jgi:hypothetical protein
VLLLLRSFLSVASDDAGYGVGLPFIGDGGNGVASIGVGLCCGGS